MPDTTERAELIGFILTHALLRNELPRLAAAFAGATDDPRAGGSRRGPAAVGHRSPAAPPPGGGRVPLAAPCLASTGCRPAARPARGRAHRDGPARRRGPATAAAPVTSGHIALSRLSELVLAHLEEEDRSVVPLLAVHITAEEQLGSMARSRAKIPQADELRVLAMMLAAADEGEQSRMLAPLPDFVVSAWSEHEAPALRRVHRVLADVAGPPRCTARQPTKPRSSHARTRRQRTDQRPVGAAAMRTSVRMGVR